MTPRPRAWLPLLLLLVPLLLSGTAAAAERTAKRELLDGRLSLRLPAGWKPLSQDALRDSLGDGALPQHAYGSDDGSRVVGVDFPRRALSPADVEALCLRVGQQVEGDAFAFQGAALRTLSGQPFCVVDFQRALEGAALRVTRAITSFEGRYLALTVTARITDAQTWEPQRDRLLEGVTLKATRIGGRCDADAPQKCLDADHHAICKDQKWQATTCAAACQPHSTVGCRFNEQSGTGLCTCKR